MKNQELLPKKSLAEMEEEGKLKHMLKVYFDDEKGNRMVRFLETGQQIQMRNGKTYLIAEDGSLRRVKQVKKGK